MAFDVAIVSSGRTRATARAGESVQFNASDLGKSRLSPGSNTLVGVLWGPDSSLFYLTACQILPKRRQKLYQEVTQRDTWPLSVPFLKVN